MTVAPTDLVPPDEAQRLAAVRRYDVLDTPPDGAFDRVAALAARLCGVPIATITIVDEDRIWFRASHGIEVDEIGRDPGLCASAILTPDAHIVTDASCDPRTLDNPLVRGELGLRFYVGVPLRTHDGFNLGTLNVIDVAPRSIDDDQVAALEDLAAIVVDELELRLAAQREVQLEASRQAARFRDAIMAGISHEMRTPLSVLQGIAALGPEEGAGEPGRRLHELLGRQVAHLERLIGQFLDYAALAEQREPAIHLAEVSLPDLVADAVGMLADRAVIEVEVLDDVPPALADRDRTLQIVTELLTNAIRFSPSGAPITVTVAADVDGTVRTSVTDEGEGITADQLARLFDREHRSEGSVGSGVGLFVSRAFAQAQGGRIEVDSTPGLGSCFQLVLPAATPTG